jgi:hypothetical protein
MTELAPFTPAKAYEIMEAVLIRGDLSDLTPKERAKYYIRLCESVGLNPMTKPFKYIVLNGELQLYALKSCTDQLRAIHKISVTELTRTERNGVFIATAKVVDADGRMDADFGAVNIAGLQGEALANALMKGATKAKRRATLSICGLAMLDETEIEDIPAHAKEAIDESEVMPSGSREPHESQSGADCKRNYDTRPPRATGAVSTIVPAPKHTLKEDGLAQRAIAARNANKWDGDGLPGDLGPPRDQPRDRESHRAMMKESMKPLDHTDRGGIPGFLRREDGEASYVDLVGAG